MSPQNQNSNKMSTTFLKTTSMIALLLGSTSLTTPDLYASSKYERAMAVDLAQREGIDRSEAAARVAIAIKANPNHPESIMDHLKVFQEEQKIDSFVGMSQEYNASDKGFNEFLLEKGVGSFDKIHDAIAVYVAAYQGQGTVAKDEDDFYAHVRVIRTYWPELNESLITDAQTARNVADLIALVAAEGDVNKKALWSSLAAIKLAYALDQDRRDDAERLRHDDVRTNLTKDNLRLIALLRTNITIAGNAITRDQITPEFFALAEKYKENAADFAALVNRYTANGVRIPLESITRHLINQTIIADKTHRAQQVIAAHAAGNGFDVTNSAQLNAVLWIADAVHNGATTFDDPTDERARAYAMRLIELIADQEKSIKIKNTAQYEAYMAAAHDLVQNRATQIADITVDQLENYLEVRIANRVTEIRGRGGLQATDVANATTIYNQFDQNLNNLTADELRIYDDGVDHFLSYRLTAGDDKNNYNKQPHTDAAAALRGYQENGTDVFMSQADNGQTRFDFDKARKNFAALVAENGNAGTIANILLLTSAGLDATVDNINAADAFRAARILNAPLPHGYVDTWTQAKEITFNSPDQDPADLITCDQDDVRAGITWLATTGAAIGGDFADSMHQRAYLLANGSKDLANGIALGNLTADQFNAFVAFAGSKQVGRVAPVLVDAWVTAKQANNGSDAAIVTAAEKIYTYFLAQSTTNDLITKYQAAADDEAKDALLKAALGLILIDDTQVLDDATLDMALAFHGKRLLDLPDLTDDGTGTITPASQTAYDNTNANLVNAITEYVGLGTPADKAAFLAIVNKQKDDLAVARFDFAVNGTDLIESYKKFTSAGFEDNQFGINDLKTFHTNVGTPADQGAQLLRLSETLGGLTANDLDAGFAAVKAAMDTINNMADHSLDAAIQTVLASRNLGNLNAAAPFIATLNNQGFLDNTLALLKAAQAVDISAILGDQGQRGKLIGAEMAIAQALPLVGGTADIAGAATLVVRLRDTLKANWAPAISITYSNTATDVDATANEARIALVSLLNGGVDADHLDRITAEDIAIARQIIIDNLRNGAVTSSTPAEDNRYQVTNLGSLVAIVNGRTAV